MYRYNLAGLRQDILELSDTLDDRFDGLQVATNARLDNLQTAIVTNTQTVPTIASAFGYKTGYVTAQEKTGADNETYQAHYPVQKWSKRSQNCRQRSTDVTVKRLKFRLPCWLLSRSLELDVSRTPLGWSVNLWPRRLVPYDCEFFQACRNLDLRRVHSLIEQGRVSVQDYDEQGRNALYVCLNRGHKTFLRS